VEDESNNRRKVRWKLALGQVDDALDQQLSQKEQRIDKALDRLYKSDRRGALSKPRTVSAKWMGEIKSLFPVSVVRVLQKDALERVGIKKLLSQPAFLGEVEPDVGLVATILSVKDALSPTALQAARHLVSRLARQIESKLKFKLTSRINGMRDPKSKVKNPNHKEIDWHLTIKQNLKNFQPSLGTIIPEVLLGRPRKKNVSKRIIILVDQSASMTESFIYAGILGSIMASINSIKTHLVVFDTDVVDLTEYLDDPVELLMRGQLGGGTNIDKAMTYASNLISLDTTETFVVLISDLFEGGSITSLLDTVQDMLNHSVNLISLLALDDQGTPVFDKEVAKCLANLGIPCFASTPNDFPDLMAAALNYEDLSKFQPR